MILRDPKTKNVKGLGQANVGAVHRKVGVCGQILTENLFFVLVCRTHSRSLSKHFQYTPSTRYKVSMWLKRQTKPASHEVGSSDTD
jgi:hypothetical protein